MKYANVIQELVSAAKSPKKTVIKTMKETGKKAIGLSPVYGPDEVVYAANCFPIGLWGGHTKFQLADKYLQSFCCSVIRANLEYGLKGDYNMLSAVVGNSFCDALKGFMKNWPYGIKHIPIIPCVYPQNRIEAGEEYLVSELTFFKTRLEELLGITISEDDLEHALTVYDEYRAACRKFVAMVPGYPVTLNPKVRHFVLKAAQFMDKKIYTEKLNALMDDLAGQPKEQLDGFKVILTGIMVDAEAYLDALVENNIIVVADDLLQESRQFRTKTRKSGTAMQRIAGRYIDQKGCALIYDEHKERGQRLIDMKNELNADAIFYCQMKFCEMEEFDYPIFKVEAQKAGVKVLYIEADQQVDASGQLANRIQAFVEINKQ